MHSRALMSGSCMPAATCSTLQKSVHDQHQAANRRHHHATQTSAPRKLWLLLSHTKRKTLADGCCCEAATMAATTGRGLPVCLMMQRPAVADGKRFAASLGRDTLRKGTCVKDTLQRAVRPVRESQAVLWLCHLAWQALLLLWHCLLRPAQHSCTVRCPAKQLRDCGVWGCCGSWLACVRKAAAPPLVRGLCHLQLLVGDGAAA